MLRKPMFWIVLIIIVAIIWFVYMSRQKTVTIDGRPTPMNTMPDQTQPAQPPASTPNTQPTNTQQQ